MAYGCDICIRILKNRSNIAASILQNPELLEQAYIASQNSQGIGQKEFDVYAQSITARMAELKNRLQELAAVTIDSQWIKDLVSFGTSAIKTITKLSKTFGGLNLAIGGVLGFLLQKTGYGITSFDKLTGTRSYGLTRIVANIKNSLSKAFGSLQVPNEIKNYFNGIDPSKKLFGEGGVLEGKLDTAPQALKDYVQGLSEAERESLTAGKAMQTLGTNVVTVGSVFDGLKNIALNALSTLGTMAIVVAATWAAGAVFKAIDEYMRRAEIAIEKGKEAQAQIAEINEGFSKQQKTVANFDAERFVDLSSRKNDVSFTTDEYNELAEVSNQLIELFPSLAGEFDSQGNAVVNLGGNVEEVTTKLADLLAQERELADFKITQNLPDVVAGIGYQNDALYKEIEEQNKVIESYKETQSFLREGRDVETANLSLTDNGFRVFAENANEGDLNFREIIEEAADKAWKESGVAFRNTFSTDVYNATTGKLGSYEYFDLGAIGEEEAEKFWSAFKIAFTDMSKETDINLADALKIKAADEREIRANWNSIKPSLISAMNTDVSFFDLQDRGDFGKQMRDTIVKNFNNVDIMDMIMSGDYEEFEKNPRRWVRQKFIDPITNAFYDNEGNYNVENQGLVEQLLRLDSSDLNTKEYRKKVMEIVKQIFPEDLAERQQFLVSLGIRDTDYNFEADNMINELAEATGVSAQEIREGVGQKDLHLLYNVYAEGKMDFKGNNFEQLLKYIETLNAEQAGHPDGVLSEVFNDEGYKEKAETFEKAASSLSSSMDTIRQNGKLTADEMRDLQEDFPDLTDFSYDGLSTKLAKNMTNWVDEIRSHWKEMGFEGQEQMETYVRNLVRSYGKNIDIADQDLNKMIVDSLLPEGTSGYERKSVQDYVSTTMSDLQELAEGEGIELDNRIIWELMLNDEFTGDAEQIFAKYKDIKMVWDIILGEDTIERLEEARSLLDAQTGLKEARGGKKTAEDYEADRAISEGVINENVKKMNGQTERQQKKIMTDIYNERAKQEQSLREQQEAEEEENIARWQRAITFNQNTIDDIQKNISNPTTTPTSAMYQEMITAGNNQMQMYEFMADYYERTRDSYENDPERWSEYNDKLHDVNNSMIELTNQQREWNEEAERLSKIEGSFAVIFENEDYVKHSDTTLKELNSVTTALEELRNEGRLTENTKIELRKVFPDLGDDIVSDDLVDKGIDKINEFVSQTRKAMSGLSEDAKQQGERYLKDTIMSLGYLGVSEDDVRNSFLDIYGSGGGSYGRKNAAEWYDSTMSELQSIAAQNGEELNMDVIYTLIASDQFSGDAQEIYDKYKDLDIEWNVVINNDELLRQLDKDMELTQKRIETTQGERDLLETKGETPNEGWYSLSNFWKELDYNLAKQAEDIAYNSYTAVKGTDLEDSKYGEYLDRVLARQKAEGEYFNSVIEQQEFPVNELEETITNQQNTTAKSIQNIMSHSLNYGKDATADMLQMNADYLRDEQTNYESLAEMWEGIYETRRSAWGEDNKHTKAALGKAQEARSSALSTEEQVVQNEAEQRQAPIKALSKDLQILQNDAQNTQNEITRLQNSGQEVGRGLYQTLIDNASEQRKILESQREEALANIEFYRTSPQYGVNSQYYIDAKQQLTEIDSQIIQLDTDTKSWKQTLETGLELNELQSNLEIIKNDAQDIQDAMSLKESRGIKSTYKDYDRLIKNSKQQISNIKRQNVLLRNQQSQILDKNNDTWKEINNQIIANNREIATLSQSQYDWGQQMVMNSINNAMANIDALDTAMSKGHMDDAESILTLIRANRDYADVLTSTTTGVYADAQALAQLKQEELDLIVAQTDAKKAAEWANYEKNERDMLSLAHAIDPTIESIDQLYDALMRNPDNPQWARIMDMAETNQGILQTIDSLQAAKEEALALSSALGKYQNALSTPNWSDPMQTIRGGMEGAKKLWDQGWVGRDDFTTFADLIATNAEVGTEDAIINFEKNYERMSKYLTEDTSGVHKWVDDMTEKASKFVKMGKDGVEFFDVDNMKEFADLMGTSTEMAEYMLMAMKDAGYNVDISRIGDEFSRTFDTISGTEANAKQLIKNLVADMGDAAKSGVDISTSADAAAESFQRLRDAGVDEEWIREQIDILNELGKDNGFYIDPQTLEVTTKVDRSELEETEKEITDPKEMLVNVKTEYGIEDVDVTNVSNAIQKAFEGNKENIKQSLKDSGLSEFSLSDLIDIKFDDGQYSEGEAALEDLAVRIGLVGDKSEVTTEMAQTLIYTLAQLGLIDVEPEVDTSEVEKANKEIEKPGVKKIKYKTEWVEETDSGTGNPGKRNGFNISEEAQSRLSYYRKIVEAREASETKYNENKESQQPMIDSVNNLGEGFDKSVDTGASKITDAISKAADTIVTGITGKSTEDGIVDNPGYKHAEEGYNTNVNKTTSSSTSSTSTDTQITPQSLSGSMTTSYTAVATVDYEVGNTKEVEQTTEELTKPEEKEVDVKLNSTGDTTSTVDTKIDTSAVTSGLNAIQGMSAVVKVGANTDEFNDETDGVIHKVDTMPDSHNVDLTASDNASPNIDNVTGKLSQLTDRNVTVNASVNGLTALTNLLNYIGRLPKNPINVVTNQITNIIRKAANSANGGGGATGTAHVSHATGTAYGMWEEYRHSIGAYANGTSEDWALPRDEDALVNEVGTESIVRDGKWFTIPGGAHIEQLKKNDILFSAAQTKELIKYGKVYSGGGHGKVAYANGTAYNMLNAHASGQNSRATTSSTRLSDLSRRNVGASTSSSSAASNATVNNNTAATKANTAATNKASGSLDAFKNWVETLFDWIEVRVERLTYKIDLSQARSENTNGYSGKNKQLDNAMKIIGALGTKRNTKTNRWSGGSGLLQDAQNGAIRYMEQATKVRQKAIANGLVNAKTADNIIKLIKEGAINISEYNEKTREFIQQYSEWYNKAQELTSQIEELKQQLKELEQTKLDNITTQFEDLAGYSSAVQATSNAIVDFYTAQGRQVNAGSVKIQYEKQIEQQNAITAAYKKERAAYMAEMKNAEKIFGKTSNEYIEAQTKLEEINQALTESETAYRDLNKQLRELDISRIEAFIDRISSFSDKLESILSLRELRGGKVVEGNYNQQISTNNDLIQRYYQDINRRRAIIKEFGWRTDSENYKEYFDAIVKDEQAIFDLLEANEKLKESIVTLRWKPFNELQNLIKEAVADYDHLRSLFKDKQLFDEEDGIFMTNKGYASLALLGAQLEATKQQIADYRKALDKVQEDYDNGNITLDKYNETSREYIEIIQNSVKSVQQYNDAITDLYKTQITNENAALQETISLRKKALQSKKAYYDYDKQLRDQNKDVNNLRAQINALQGVNVCPYLFNC